MVEREDRYIGNDGHATGQGACLAERKGILDACEPPPPPVHAQAKVRAHVDDRQDSRDRDKAHRIALGHASAKPQQQAEPVRSGDYTGIEEDEDCVGCPANAAPPAARGNSIAETLTVCTGQLGTLPHCREAIHGHEARPELQGAWPPPQRHGLRSQAGHSRRHHRMTRPAWAKVASRGRELIQAACQRLPSGEEQTN
jgi:hypothetical protein